MKQLKNCSLLILNTKLHTWHDTREYNPTRCNNQTHINNSFNPIRAGHQYNCFDIFQDSYGFHTYIPPKNYI